MNTPTQDSFDARDYLLGTEGSNPLAKWPEDKRVIIQTGQNYDVGNRTTIDRWYNAPSRYRVLAMLDNQVTVVHPSGVLRLPNGDYRLRQDRRDGSKAERIVHPDEVVVAVHGPARGGLNKVDISAEDVLPSRRVREAWEQPGPDMPQDPDGEQPEENFDPREYFLAGDTKGHKRKEWVEKALQENGYVHYVPYASKGTYSDFDEQANYEYLEHHYSWLNYSSEVIGFDFWKIENPDRDEIQPGTPKPTVEGYLSEIEDDEWDQFKQDVREVKNGACLDDDRSNELRMAAETEYFKDNYHDLIDALRERPWIHKPDYQWLLQAVGTLDEEDVWKLATAHDFYPESEGQGSVYLDFKKLAQNIDPDELITLFQGQENFEDSEATPEYWEKIKNEVWNDARSTGYLFDKEMKEQLAEYPELLERYNQMEPREVRALFDRALGDAAENPKGNEYPRWVLFKPGYYDQPKIERWVVMYPLDRGDWARMGSTEKQDHVEGSMEEFVRDYVLPMFAQTKHRVPKEHPELPFTSGIQVGSSDAHHGQPSDDVNQYLPPPRQESQEQPTPQEIKKEAAKAEEPASEAQAKAGNYQKGHIEFHGFEISIENAKGSTRSGKGKDGKEWSVTMPAHYGYIKGTVGKDKDHIDVYIGEHPDSTKVYVVNQQKLEGGFDEHKIMLGFESKEQAIETYDKAFTGDLGPKLREEVVVTNIEKLKDWLSSGDTKAKFKQPVAESEDFDAREYTMVEPIAVKEWLGVKGFKEVANGAWQWENEQHQLFVMEHDYMGVSQWTLEDYDFASGETRKYRWVVADKNNATQFIRLLRKRMEHQPEQVAEAAEPPPEPVPQPPDEFDPRAYFSTPTSTGKLVKETPTMWLMKPTTDTVEQFVETNRSGVNNTRIVQVMPLYMVIPKDGSPRFLIGIWEDGTLYAPPFTKGFVEKVIKEKPFSKDLRRFFRSHAIRFLRDEDDSSIGLRLLADLYGAKVVLKYLKKYDAPDDLKMKLGIDEAKRGNFQVASKLLNHPVERMSDKGVSWRLSDYSDLSQFFETRYQKSAESILSGDPVDADWIYDAGVKPKVKELIRHLDAKDYELIRELLVHRVIYPMDDQQPVMLSTENLKQFDNEDIAYWLTSEPDDEIDPEGALDDIRQALVQAAIYAWEQAITDDWFEGYKNSALDAIDASAEWKDGKVLLSVAWSTVEKWLEEAKDNGYEPTDLDDLLYNHSPRAEPSDDYSTTGWDEVGSLSEFINDQLAELEPADYPYDPNQLTMPELLGPDPNEYLEVTSYSHHTPHGYATKMKRKDVEKWNRDEPWRLNPEKWAAYAKEKGIEIPPKQEPLPAPSVGESLADVLMEKAYKYATTQLDVPAPQSDFIFEWGRLNVPDEALYFGEPDSNPRETEQHITVLYGLTVNDVPDELRAITEGYKPFPVYIGKVSLFRQDTHDVVKLDVESPWLRKLSGEIRAAIPNENKYPEYVPHLTIAYVKKGSCDALEGKDIFQGQPGAVDPQFIAYGLVFKGAGDDNGNRVRETLLFTRTKKVRPVESGPFHGVPFPLDPEHTGQFLRLTRSRARRPIL